MTFDIPTDLAPPPPDLPLLRICAQEGCENVLPPGVHALRKYCDDHMTTGGSSKKPAKKKDRQPSTVKIQLGGAPTRANKADADLAQVEQRIRQLVSTISGLLIVMGSPADAADVARGKDELARAVKELARYEPWLKKLALGGEAPDRIMAWVGVAMALAGILIPILDRRGKLPEQLRPMVTDMIAMSNVDPTQVIVDDGEPRGAHAAA